MAIHIGLILAMKDNNIHDITVITNSISATSKVLESKVDPLQNMVIPVVYAIKSYLFKDSRNRIHFQYYPSKTEWPRHKLIDNQVKVGTNALEFPCKHSYLFNRKKEYDNILQEWQLTFANSLKRGHYFLMFENEDQQVIKPIYVKGSSQLPVIGFTNFLCACFTCMTTGHAPIGEYKQRFFSNLPTSYLCGKAEVQTYKYIIIECDLHHPSTCPCNIIINSFVHFLVDNPRAFSFDYSQRPTAVQLLEVKVQLSFLLFSLFLSPILFFVCVSKQVFCTYHSLLTHTV